MAKEVYVVGHIENDDVVFTKVFSTTFAAEQYAAEQRKKGHQVAMWHTV